MNLIRFWLIPEIMETINSAKWLILQILMIQSNLDSQVHPQWINCKNHGQPKSFHLNQRKISNQIKWAPMSFKANYEYQVFSSKINKKLSKHLFQITWRRISNMLTLSYLKRAKRATGPHVIRRRKKMKFTSCLIQFIPI